MPFDIGFGELVALAIIGLIVVGPERLPQYAAQAARFLRQFRSQVSDARSTILEAADVDPATLRDLRELDPRRVLRDAITEPTRPAAESKLDPDTT